MPAEIDNAKISMRPLILSVDPDIKPIPRYGDLTLAVPCTVALAPGFELSEFINRNEYLSIASRNAPSILGLANVECGDYMSRFRPTMEVEELLDREAAQHEVQRQENLS